MLTSWPHEETNVFHYGFLSSRTSAALDDYLDTKQVSTPSRVVLEEANHLLEEILSAQKNFGKEKDSAISSETTLSGFGCALEVIIANRSDFKVESLYDFATMFETLNSTIEQLLNGSQAKKTDVETTRMFFMRFSQLMLAQISSPTEAQSMVF